MRVRVEICDGDFKNKASLESSIVKDPRERFTYEEIDSDRKNCYLIHHDGSLTRVIKNGITYYICPFDYAVLFKKINTVYVITLEGPEAWYSRETGPQGCDHYRWFIYRREDLVRLLDSFQRYSIAVLLGSKIVFVLDRRREGFPGPFTY